MARPQSHQAVLRPTSESLLARRGGWEPRTAQLVTRGLGWGAGPAPPCKADVEAVGILCPVLGRASCHLAPRLRQPGSDSRPGLAQDICPDKVTNSYHTARAPVDLQRPENESPGWGEGARSLHEEVGLF